MIILHIKEALANWRINWKDSFYCVHDNAGNLTKAVNVIGFTSVPCVNHTLQLAIEGSLKHKGVEELLIQVRTIVRHFHRSTKATQLLRDRQKSLGHAQLKLIKDNETRWNSKYYMLARFMDLQTSLNSLLPHTNCTIKHVFYALMELLEEQVYYGWKLAIERMKDLWIFQTPFHLIEVQMAE